MAGIWVDKAGTRHETFQLLTFIGSDFLGQTAFDGGNYPSLRYLRFGLAYFCPSCGDIWARLVVVDGGGRQREFESRRVSCLKHPDLWEMPGSLLAIGLDDLLHLLPPAALQREFMIHLDRSKI